MRLVTADELRKARILPWSRGRIYEAARLGLIPAVKAGRQWLFDLERLEAWAAGGGTPLPGGWRREAQE